MCMLLLPAAYGPQPWLQTPSSSVASMSDTVAYVMGYANETVSVVVPTSC
jgi:hypothetical protein